jgi:hypothetical protein
MPSDGELYVLEKLVQAVYALVTHSGRVQERLEEAYRDLISAQPDDVADDELRRMLVGIKDDLTFDQPAGSEGRLKATLRNLNDEDASAIAARILMLRDRLWEQIGNTN